MLTEQEADGVEFEFDSEHMPEFAVGAEPEYFELWLADGTLVQRSPSFEPSDQMRAAGLARSPHPAATPTFRDVRLPDGRRGRQIHLDFVPSLDPEDEPATAAPAPRRRAARSRPCSLRANAGARHCRPPVGADRRRPGRGPDARAGWAHAARPASRPPLPGPADRPGAGARGDLSRCADRRGGAAPEIAVVVEQVNALLGRIEASFKRERRLSSDIAHELKTPIAELRNLSEVGARWPEDRASVRQFFEDTGAIAQQMERVVVHLLALARYDEGREQVGRLRCGVAEAVDAAWKPLAREAAAKGLVLRQEISPTPRLRDGSGEVRADRVQPSFQRRRLQPAGRRRGVRVGGDGGRASVRFSNQAENLEPQDLAVMFDRFWRKDETRTGGRNVGLGLALVRALADLLGLVIETRLLPDRTFRITLSKPVPGLSPIRSGTALRRARPRRRRSTPGTPLRAGSSPPPPWRRSGPRSPGVRG